MNAFLNALESFHLTQNKMYIGYYTPCKTPDESSGLLSNHAQVCAVLKFQMALFIPHSPRQGHACSPQPLVFVLFT